MQLDENASAAWLASTVNRKMPAAALEGVDIGATARRALNHRALQNLRVEGHLMYGVAALVAQKTHLLASRTGRTRRELERELNGEDNLMDQAITTEIPTQSQSIDMISSDFNMDRVMEEFRPSQLSQGSDEVADISIDDELRGEVDDELRREDPAEAFAPELLSDGDEQILRGILGDDEPVPAVVEEAVMELPDDAAFEEALTPPSMPDMDDDIEADQLEAPSKLPTRPRKKRLCPVDERTTITRSTRAPTSTLLSSRNAANGTVELGFEGDGDDFFDPERISDSIKRRRLVDIPSDVPELEHSEADVSIAGISMDGLLDDDMGDDLGGDSGYYDDVPAATQDVVGSILEQENLEDLMAEEIQTARRTIKEFGSGKLSEIPSHTQRSRAALFSEALALATIGDISLEQDAPYREIMLLAI